MRLMLWGAVVLIAGALALGAKPRDLPLPLVRTLSALEHADSADAARFILAQSALVTAAAIWDQDGRLIYPAPTDISHTLDDAARPALPSWQQMRQGDQTWAWNGPSGESVLHCTQRACVAIDSDHLERLLGKPASALIDGRPDRSLLLVMALAVLGVGLAWPQAPIRSQAPIQAGVQANTPPSTVQHHDTPAPQTVLGDVTVDETRLIARRGALEAPLTRRDARLLSHFASHPGQVISKDELYDIGWGRDFLPNSRALEQHILTLRRKLDPDRTRPAIIETVHGQGYRFPGA